MAARYLRRHRHRVLVRNYRCVAGEIDLVCAHGDTIVFVEVKTRTSDEAEDVQDAPRPSQWRRIEQAARYFLMEHAAQTQPCRFDLITVLWPPGQSAKIEHFQNVHQPRQP
jgi:putative endonuclease